MSSVVSNIRELDLTLDDIRGRGFRKNIIQCVLPLGSKSRLPSIDCEIGEVGIRVDVGHSGAAKGHILEALHHVAKGDIGSLLFITQTEALAMSRNTDTDKTGNRIYYEILVDDIERYGSSMITCPVGVLGVYLSE